MLECFHNLSKKTIKQIENIIIYSTLGALLSHRGALSFIIINGLQNEIP